MSTILFFRIMGCGSSKRKHVLDVEQPRCLSQNPPPVKAAGGLPPPPHAHHSVEQAEPAASTSSGTTSDAEVGAPRQHIKGGRRRSPKGDTGSPKNDPQGATVGGKKKKKKKRDSGHTSSAPRTAEAESKYSIRTDTSEFCGSSRGSSPTNKTKRSSPSKPSADESSGARQEMQDGSASRSQLRLDMIDGSPSTSPATRLDQHLRQIDESSDDVSECFPGEVNISKPSRQLLSSWVQWAANQRRLALERRIKTMQSDGRFNRAAYYAAPQPSPPVTPRDKKRKKAAQSAQQLGGILGTLLEQGSAETTDSPNGVRGQPQQQEQQDGTLQRAKTSALDEMRKSAPARNSASSAAGRAWSSAPSVSQAGGRTSLNSLNSSGTGVMSPSRGAGAGTGAESSFLTDMQDAQFRAMDTQGTRLKLGRAMPEQNVAHTGTSETPGFGVETPGFGVGTPGFPGASTGSTGASRSASVAGSAIASPALPIMSPLMLATGPGSAEAERLERVVEEDEESDVFIGEGQLVVELGAAAASPAEAKIAAGGAFAPGGLDEKLRRPGETPEPPPPVPDGAERFDSGSVDDELTLVAETARDRHEHGKQTSASDLAAAGRNLSSSAHARPSGSAQTRTAKGDLTAAEHDPDHDQQLHPPGAYQPGQAVLYWSGSRNRWVPGTVREKVNEDIYLVDKKNRNCLAHVWIGEMMSLVELKRDRVLGLLDKVLKETHGRVLRDDFSSDSSSSEDSEGGGAGGKAVAVRQSLGDESDSSDG